MNSEESRRWCAICSSPADRKLDKTEILNVLTTYFEKILVDIKPTDNAKHGLCLGCFEKLEELNDTHEAREKLKTRIRRDRAQLIKVVLDGVQKRKEKNMPFLGVHSKIQALNHVDEWSSV